MRREEEHAELTRLREENERLTEALNGKPVVKSELEALVERAEAAETKLAEAQRETGEQSARRIRAEEVLEDIRKAFTAELAAARERVWAIHTMLEKFADDLDTGPSTHLLATELRNRWRALRSSEEPKPTAAAAPDAHSTPRSMRRWPI